MRQQVADYRKQRGYPFDLNDSGNWWAVDISGFSDARVFATPLVGWSAAVLTIYQSYDGVNPAALTTPQTITAPSAIEAKASAAIDGTSIPFIIIRLTTADGGAATCDLAVVAKTQEP